MLAVRGGTFECVPHAAQKCESVDLRIVSTWLLCEVWENLPSVRMEHHWDKFKEKHGLALGSVNTMYESSQFGCMFLELKCLCTLLLNQ